MEHLNGPRPSLSANFAISHSSEEPKTEMSKNIGNSKNHRDVSKLPRFMKPTASSQQRIGLNKYVPASNRTKPPVPPKTKRRPSSVYAESIRLPVHTATWQSECSSECSISMTGDMNWLPSMQDDTECRKDTSECETKQVIFSEDENMLKDQVISVTECQHEEPGKVQNVAEQMGIIDIESWIHQKIIENTVISQSIRVIDIPEVTEHGTCDSSTTSQLHMEWTKDFKQGQDEDSGMNLSSPTHNIKDIKQTKVANQIATTELCTPPSEELCRNTEIKEQKNERLAYHGSYRRSLKEIMDSYIPKQLDKEAKADLSIIPEIRFQDKEHYTGIVMSNIRQSTSTKVKFRRKGHYRSGFQGCLSQT
jgi:kinesin family member C1